jgi:hypothetical protein
MRRRLPAAQASAVDAKLGAVEPAPNGSPDYFAAR